MAAVGVISPRARRHVILAAALAAAVSTALLCTNASAAGRAAAGKELAERWCTGCHQVALGEPINDAAPSFPALVRERGGDLSWARAWLFDPHPPMEGIALSRQEIDDVVAYLRSLSENHQGGVP